MHSNIFLWYICILIFSFMQLIDSDTVLDETKEGKASPRMKAEVIVISDKAGEIRMNGTGMTSSHFLKLISKMKQSLPIPVGKKRQGQEEGVVINDVGDLVRVHIDRNLVPIFFRILKSLNVDVGKWFSPNYATEKIPTTTPYVPTTTKQFFYIVFEDTTTEPSTTSGTLISRGKYKVIKSKTTSTTKVPTKRDEFYVDDEDETQALKNFGRKRLKQDEKKKMT